MQTPQPTPPVIPPATQHALRTPTVAVTVRLEVPRYTRLKAVAQSLGMTQQDILSTALDNRIVMLERRAHNTHPVPGQLSLLGDPVEEVREPDPEPEKRPEGTIGVGYRATEIQHRWLHAEAARRGTTIQTLITDTLRHAGMPG